MKKIFLTIVLTSCTTVSTSVVNGLYDPDPALKSFDPAWKPKRKKLKSELETFKARLFASQKSGRDVTCAKQILEEASAALGAGAQLDFVKERLADLAKSLDDTKPQSWANEQSPADGSWGACYKQWYWKVVASTEQIRELDHENKLPQYPTKFLDQINSPKSLTVYLDSVLISDIAKDGKVRRRELNECGTTLVKLIAKGLPRNYQYHPKLQDALYDYLDKKWQNPETGYWGAWFRDGDKLVKTDDLSITFHIASYRRREAALWDKIARTTLAIRDRPYPFGWHDSEGRMSNHHNYDVVRLLRLGWNHLEEHERNAARTEFRKMLDWCLKESLQADGSFLYNHSDDSLGDSYYFGVSLLSELGFFERKRRFWTTEDFPQANELRLRILGSLHKVSGNDPMFKNAAAILEGRD